MKLLVVNWLDRENPRAGGAEAHLHEIFGRLAARGHEVTLLCSGWPGLAPRATVDGLEVFRVGGRHTFLLQAWPFARRHLAGRGFDLVIEDLNKVPLFTPAWRIAPVVLLVHHLFGDVAFQEASFPFALATWLLERPVGRLYRGRPTVAVSESTRRDLMARGLRAGDIEVIPNGVDVEWLRPLAGDGEGRFPDPSLLYLGRLQRYKRVDLVLRATARLKSRGFPVRLRVAGRGEAESELRALAQKLELSDAVEFLGFVSEDRKRELLRRSWVHVLTSPKEGWGITNVEAAACGTPTVASDAPGLRDSVRDGETGYLVPHGDVEALADRLAELVRHGDLRARMGAAARRFAEAHTWSAAADRFEAFLQARVAGARSRS
jgi:glycosyltransferase involved in cell wall biosynthesis